MIAQNKKGNFINKVPFQMLANQGSNLDSSGPKPDVLPVTPSASLTALQI